MKRDVLDIICWALGASVAALLAMMGRVVYVAWRERGRDRPTHPDE